MKPGFSCCPGQRASEMPQFQTFNETVWFLRSKRRPDQAGRAGGWCRGLGLAGASSEVDTGHPYGMGGSRSRVGYLLPRFPATAEFQTVVQTLCSRKFHCDPELNTSVIPALPFRKLSPQALSNFPSFFS